MRQIVKENADFAAKRRNLMKSLAFALRGQPETLDPALRAITVKFSRLPFAAINGNCEGHFFKAKAKEGFLTSRISLGEARGIKELYSHPAYFGIYLNHSSPAQEFKGALFALRQKVPFLEIDQYAHSTEIFVSAHIQDAHTLIPKEKAYGIRKDNLLFIKEFGKIVDKFVKKYGLGKK